MRIVSIGGGPAGLYFSLLIKKAFPRSDVAVYERNRPEDTFGWGVVFSDETLGAFEDADPESYAEITSKFSYWRDIETFYDGAKTVSTGHGFCALARRELLQILQRRCEAVGVDLHFEHEVASLEEFADADLILGADGVNSWVRGQLAEHFEPQLDWRRCRFTWLGTDMPMDAFTFIFKPTEWGLFQVHAYPFTEGLGTFIVECHEDVWHRAGLEGSSEEETIEFCQALFADHLGSHRLFGNRSIWRQFPTVRCRTWRHDNVVLVGDAAHTAHFSIGSGTKLAMEDAIALAETFGRFGLDDVAGALEEYEENRWVDVLKLQKAAQTSLEWFENSSRYLDQTPERLTFNLMTRSKRITFDNLGVRDPELIRDVALDFQRQNRRHYRNAPPPSPRPPIFTPYQLDDLDLENRMVVSPMCQYSATDGVVDDWHLVHYGSRAIGGAGLLITEMTDVEAEGRISLGCAGLWNDDQEAAWRRIVDFVHAQSRTKVCIQLAHAGRKASMHHPWDADDRPLREDEGGWRSFGPTDQPFHAGWPAPKAMDHQDLDRVKRAFVDSALRAERAGFDAIELHMAHGYLLSSFLSPLSNRRQDAYGGSLENRMRYPLEVFEAMRAVWRKPLIVRVSATDWAGEDGQTVAETVELAKRLKRLGCPLIDVSSAGNSPESKVEYGRMYQVPFAEQIRYEAEMPVMAVGAILGADHANTVLAAGRADLTALARPHLRDPYLTLHAAEHYEQWQAPWPGQYLLGAPQPPRGHQRKTRR
ncbi:MAG: FAD-dependent monooxygenase [Acidobacteriota bacterium]